MRWLETPGGVAAALNRYDDLTAGDAEHVEAFRALWPLRHNGISTRAMLRSLISTIRATRRWYPQ
jgi:hypothetical protein